MSDKNVEVLFAYLQSILYDQQIKSPELSPLDQPYRKFGEELARLGESVEEARVCLSAFLEGNLPEKCPSEQNLLFPGLKELYSRFEYLIWQAEKVTGGDYSQQVSFPGDFSKAFNRIIAQLQEKELLLLREMEVRKLREEESYNHLLAELTKKRSEWILVVDTETKEILFCNKKRAKVDDRPDGSSFCDKCHYQLSFKPQILSWTSDEPYAVWEAEDAHGNVYQVTSFLTEWQERKAYAHVVMDTTEEANETRQLTRKAYHDPGTGIENRRYFEEYMEEVLKEKREVTLCYMDLDGLKYVNDMFGHQEGDEYIRGFVAIIKTKIRATDVFARIGGDEFCLIFPGCHKDAVNEKIREALEQMVGMNRKPYPVSFSFGVIELHKEECDTNLEKILKQADTKMYLCKRENKRKFHENREVR